MEIRPYQQGDHDAVVDLWELVFPDDPPWNRPALVIERKLRVQPDLFLLGVTEGSIVGTTLAGFDGVRGWVHHVAVHPGHRRQGVAQALMRKAEVRLMELGCPKLNLQVRLGNDAAVALYQRLGYQVEPRVSMGKLLGDKPPTEP